MKNGGSIAVADFGGNDVEVLAVLLNLVHEIGIDCPHREQGELFKMPEVVRLYPLDRFPAGVGHLKMRYIGDGRTRVMVHKQRQLIERNFDTVGAVSVLLDVFQIVVCPLF